MQASNPFKQFISYAVIDLDTVADNVQALKQHTGAGVEMFAVLKANGYGHGIVQVARVVVQNGAERIAVGRVGEGAELRAAGINASILVLGYTLPAQADALLEHDLMAVVNTLEGAQALSARAEALGRKATVHIKIDTGMGRYGLLPEEALAFMRQISTLSGLNLEGICTHFATADATDKSYVHKQYQVFQGVVEELESAGFSFRMKHVANSAATLDMPELHLDAVRPGVALYGMYPSDEVSRDVKLKPALSFKSHVSRVRTLPAGSSISYGRTYRTEKDEKVALVLVGYGDGYQRVLSNKGHVLIRGQRAPIEGRVCMDQFVVNVSEIEGVAQDDEVVLLGEQQGVVITADDVAATAGTINYEITTSLLPRIPRIYVQNGEVVEIAAQG